MTDPRALRGHLIRQARIFAILLAALLVVDLTTGPRFWVQWPGLCMVVILAYQAAPLGAQAGIRLRDMRAGVIISALFLINLFTWHGTLWAIWPAAAVVVLILIRRRRAQPR